MLLAAALQKKSNVEINNIPKLNLVKIENTLSDVNPDGN